MRKAFMIFFIAVSFQLSAFSSMADTIYTKDDKEIKGIVVEEYKDRVLMSTVDGERTMMKSEIKELYFDTEEQNLTKLAEQARDRGDYIKAFVYYDKAFRVNPDSKAAKDGIVFLQGYLFKKDMAQKEEVVKRHNEFEEKGAGPATIKSDEEKFKDEIKKLKAKAGIALRSSGGATEIESVSEYSPAYDAGLREGDVLIAVWGRLVGYLSLQEVIETLLEKTSLETKCTIERNINTKDLIGVNFKMELEGLTVADVKDGSPAQAAGLKQKDIVMDINGNATRYMPFKRAVELIKKSEGDNVKLTVRREVVMWGKGGE